MLSIGLTAGFCFIILILFADFWRRGGRVPQGPAILTMVGICGTFLGIAIGLSTFKTTDITGSIPRLIDGMKIAVWASFAGVLFAIVLKYRDALLESRYDSLEGGQEGGGDVDGLRDLIGTGEHTSLLSELKLLRRDLGERITRIERSMEFFSERFARQNAKAIAEALKENETTADVKERVESA